MSTHNIGFYEEISKITPLLSSNTHLISSIHGYIVLKKCDVRLISVNKCQLMYAILIPYACMYVL